MLCILEWLEETGNREASAQSQSYSVGGFPLKPQIVFIIFLVFKRIMKECSSLLLEFILLYYGMSLDGFTRRSKINNKHE